jgi:hypothetical protein
MTNYPKIGIQVPQIFLPKPAIDLKKWAVIACDQFTSELDYWDNVQKIVDNSPSTLNLFLPEAYLGTPNEELLVKQTQLNMRKFLDEKIFDPFEGIILVERTVNGKTRHGIMLALDLEQYDFNKGSQSLIRATEGTILERIPPRIRIREGALLELPHILVLIDDPQGTVIQPLVEKRSNFRKIYDFDLMMDSGHLSGYFSNDKGYENQLVNALEKLSEPKFFQSKYNVGPDKGVLLFAMGDGNHSLATAKAIWEKNKSKVGMDHPSRYALVEIENVHDEGLDFEPIHRILFGVEQDFKASMQSFYGDNFRFIPIASDTEIIEKVKNQSGAEHLIGVIAPSTAGLIAIKNSPSNLPVGSLQMFLDDWLKKGGAGKIDYVHGTETTFALGKKAGNLGFFLPAMKKSDLFKTVILDGALPRKTFSMGEAREKRFYMECRRITTP